MNDDSPANDDAEARTSRGKPANDHRYEGRKPTVAMVHQRHGHGLADRQSHLADRQSHLAGQRPQSAWDLLISSDDGPVGNA